MASRKDNDGLTPEQRLEMLILAVYRGDITVYRHSTGEVITGSIREIRDAIYTSDANDLVYGQPNGNGNK